MPATSASTGAPAKDSVVSGTAHTVEVTVKPKLVQVNDSTGAKAPSSWAALISDCQVGQRGNERGQRLGGDAILRGFGDGRRFICGKDGEHFGEIGGRKRQGTGDDIDFLFLRRMPGTNRGAQVGANGRLPRETVNLSG